MKWWPTMKGSLEKPGKSRPEEGNNQVINLQFSICTDGLSQHIWSYSINLLVLHVWTISAFNFQVSHSRTKHCLWPLRPETWDKTERFRKYATLRASTCTVCILQWSQLQGIKCRTRSRYADTTQAPFPTRGWCEISLKWNKQLWNLLTSVLVTSPLGLSRSAWWPV